MDELERGRGSYAARAWRAAYDSLTRAGREKPLGAEDLERLSTAAYMLGRAEDHTAALERAHRAHLDADLGLRAARCAFWAGILLFQTREMGRASGWLARAQRLVEREGTDCVERGYLLLPVMFQQEGSGETEGAAATAAAAVEIAERFRDADLQALAEHHRGHLLVKLGRVADGLALLDKSMLAVTAGELSPIVSGIVYCGVILGCQDAYELRRAREWTAALTEWCEEQPEMVSFTGRCLLHRAEIMQLNGAWPDALDEARRAGLRCSEGRNELAAAEAVYLEGEIHRLKGDFEAAEEAYREASRRGYEPQPGLALLRLAQANPSAANAAIRRVLDETRERPKRARLLPAYIDVMLAVNDIEEARSACRELEDIAADYEGGMLTAIAAHARGAVDLAAEDPRSALPELRRAAQSWRELGAPYQSARARVLLGLACRAVGDHDTAALELEAARHVFEELGAAPELARLDSLTSAEPPGGSHGLSARELEVLRLVAAGRTNRAVADELVLSVRTVDRHVSNIFAKLGVSSRVAATAYAHEHQLL